MPVPNYLCRAVEIGEETRAKIFHPVALVSRECPVLALLRISGVCILCNGFIRSLQTSANKALFFCSNIHLK